MEFLFALPILFIPLFFPLIGGLMAQCYGRKFWLWFWLSIPLPFISLIILLSLPDRSKQEKAGSVCEADEFGIYL